MLSGVGVYNVMDYRSGLPFPFPGDLPDPGIKPAPLLSPTLTGGLFNTDATWELVYKELICYL